MSPSSARAQNSSERPSQLMQRPMESTTGRRATPFCGRVMWEVPVLGGWFHGQGEAGWGKGSVGQHQYSVRSWLG